MVWVQSMLCKYLVVCRENGTEGKIVDIGRFLGGRNDLMEECDVYECVSAVVGAIVLRYSPASVSGDSSSWAVCSSRDGDDGRIGFA